jgi:hypothetical protein
MSAAMLIFVMPSSSRRHLIGHPIRVVLTQMPKMLRYILADALAGQPDIVLVQEAGFTDEVGWAVDHASADVVITGMDVGASRQLCESLLRGHPGLTVFSIPEDRSGACGWTLRLHGEPLGDVSTEGLIDAIRLAVRQPVGET